MDQKQRLNKKTIWDIARLANASPATVSRVLNNTDYPVSEQMRSRVLKAAEELNYRPNIFSQMLKGAKSKEIGIIIPSIDNPYYSLLTSVVAKCCVKNDYAPIICSSFGDQKLEKRQLEILLRQQVAGILYSSVQDEVEKNLLESDHGALPPIIMFDQSGSAGQMNSVVFDFERAGKLVTDYLIENGHKRIAFASGPLDRSSRKQVLKGYKEALSQAGIPYRPELVLTEDALWQKSLGLSDFDKGNVLGEQILKMDPLPDAVLGINDITAIGIMNKLKENQLDVPGQISITGLDDIEMASMTVPGLTTIRQPARSTGEAAMNLLIDCIEDNRMKPQKIVIEPELVTRSSVKRRI